MEENLDNAQKHIETQKINRQIRKSAGRQWIDTVARAQAVPIQQGSWRRFDFLSLELHGKAFYWACTFSIVGNICATHRVIWYLIVSSVGLKASHAMPAMWATPLSIDWINTTVFILPKLIDYLLSDAKRMNVACNWIVFTHLPFLNDTPTQNMRRFCTMLSSTFSIYLSTQFSVDLSCAHVLTFKLYWMSCIRLCYQWNMLVLVQCSVCLVCSVCSVEQSQ